jgi:hypothetical protein
MFSQFLVEILYKVTPKRGTKIIGPLGVRKKFTGPEKLKSAWEIGGTDGYRQSTDVRKVGQPAR